MALVLLPCDLPTWPAVQRHLTQLKESQNSSQLVEGMLKLYTICCISLDPDEDKRDPCLFDGLQSYIDEALNAQQRDHFYQKTLPSIVKYALALKVFKPIDGLQYSLQQRSECTELEKKFVASILANAFFSTFPKRTTKTHPTLQDCNFSNFFAHLTRPSQRIKFTCFLRYFDQIADKEPRGKISVTRQVTLKKDLLTMDDWLSCDVPLCPVTVRHDGRIEHADNGTYQVCFSSARIGGNVLEGGNGQEELVLFAFPELLVVLCCVEALEDNEALAVRGFAIANRLHGNGNDVRLEDNVLSDGSWDSLESHICLMDAIDYHEKPIRQYYAANIARELNKASIGFRQKESSIRLPPIGQSCSSTPPEERKCSQETHNIIQTAIKSNREDTEISTLQLKTLMNKKDGLCNLVDSLLRKPSDTTVSVTADSSRRSSAITGSSSEDITLRTRRLPTPPKQDECCRDASNPVDSSTTQKADSDDSVYKDCVEWLPQPVVTPSVLRPLRLVQHFPTNFQTIKERPNEESFLTASSNMNSDSDDDSEEEEHFSSCTEDIEEEPKPQLQSAKPAVIPRRDLVSGRRCWQRDCSSDTGRKKDVQVSVPGGHPEDPEDEMLLRRSGSTGFLLEEEDDDDFPRDSLEYSQGWLNQFRQKTVNPSRSVSRRNSSRYSFSSDFSSDLEDIYEHFEEKMAQGGALDDPEMASRFRVYGRGERILKRTLSDSMTTLPHHHGRAEGHPMTRSLSLTDRLQQERTAMERAKRHLEMSGDSDEEAVFSNDPSQHLPGNWRWVGTPVNIEQNLTQSHQCLVIPPPNRVVRINKLTKHPSQLSVWWNYNDTYDFNVPLKKWNYDKSTIRPPSPVSARTWHTMPCRLVTIEESPQSTNYSYTGKTRSLIRSASAKEIPYATRQFQPVKNDNTRDSADIDMSQKESSGGILRKWHATLNLNDSGDELKNEPEFLGSVTNLVNELSDVHHRQVPDYHHQHHHLHDHMEDYLHAEKIFRWRDNETLTSAQTSHQVPVCEGSVERLQGPLQDPYSECETSRIIVTGNWGCGKKAANPQLKAMIQWMAASRVRCPCMIYYTSGNESVVKLNVVCRILLDRHWSVSHLARAVLKYSQNIDYRSGLPPVSDLFDELLPKETDL